MPRRPRRQSVQQAFTVTIPEIATAIGRTDKDTRRLLLRYRRILSAPTTRVPAATYPATVIDELRELLGQPTDAVDWLDRYLQEGPDGQT